jgi:methenyltetrahydromethanopterin cyclohydrolase
MSILEKSLKGYKAEGTKRFPVYRMNSIESGKIFAEASMGSLGRVDYGVSGSQITIKTTIENPVLATLGMQLAGWCVDSAMVSGPIRLRAKKPSFIFDKLRFEDIPDLPNVGCIEGDANPTTLINKLLASDIKEAALLWTTEKSYAQLINIPARACEIAIFRLFNLTDLNKIKIDKAWSTVRASISFKGDPSSYLNDCIRFDGEVVLQGDFAGFKDFPGIVTKNTKYADQTFEEIMKKAGGIKDCPMEAFSVGKLTIIDPKRKTKTF